MSEEEFLTPALFNLAAQLGGITAAGGIVKRVGSERYTKTCKLFPGSKVRSCFRSYQPAFFPSVPKWNFAHFLCCLFFFYYLQAVRICL